MPIDPNVSSLAVRSLPGPPDLLGTLDAAAQVRQREAIAQEHQRKAQGQKALQMAVQQAGGDYDKAAEMLEQRGFGDVALGLREEVGKQREQLYKTQGERLKARGDELKLFTSLANLITDDTSQQLVIKSLSPELQQMAVQTLGETYDPNRVKTVQDALLTSKERADMQSTAFKDFLEGQKFQRGTAEWTQKMTAALGQYLSATNTPQEYNEVLESAPQLGISPEVASIFRGKTAQDAAQIGMTAKERADLANAAADNTRADAQLAISRGQLGVAQGNLALRRQEVSGGAGGGPIGKADTELVDAILKNPAIYDGLTPTVKTRLAAELARRGFTGFAKAGGEGAGLTPSMQGGINRLKATIGQLEQMDKGLTQLPGIAGKVAGNVQNVLSWAGTDETATVYDGLADTLLPALARASGEVGNLAQQEQIRYGKLAPRVTDPINIRRRKIAAIKELVAASERGATADQMRPILDVVGTEAAAPAGSQAKSFSVTAPNGKTYTFKTAAELAAFKSKAGIK